MSCESLERIIHSNIIDHLCKNNVLTDSQHGFRKPKSCEATLITIIAEMVKTLNDGEQSNVAIFDFSKIFKEMNHHKQCLKIERYGVRGI